MNSGTGSAVGSADNDKRIRVDKDCLGPYLFAHVTKAHFLFTTRFATRTMSSMVGSAMASKLAAYGIGTSAPHIRSGAASSSSCDAWLRQQHTVDGNVYDRSLLSSYSGSRGSSALELRRTHERLLGDHGDDLGADSRLRPALLR